MASDSAGKGVLLKSDLIAGAFRDEIKAAIAQSPRRPKLVGILATAAAPSKFYADFTKKQCDELGVEFVLKTTGSAANPALSDGEGVEEAIIDANNDDTVDGIMVCIILDFDRLFSVPTCRVCSIKVYYPVFGVQQVCTCPALVRIASTEAVHVGSLSAAGKYRDEALRTLGGMLRELQVVSPLKDVEGLHFKFHYNLYHK